MGGPQGWSGGCRGKRLNSEAVPARLTCARGSQLRTSSPEAQSSRGGGGAERLRRKGLPWPQRARPVSPLAHLNPLMAGTMTTRKHVRTHALSTQPVQARARKRAGPAFQTFAPPLTKPRPYPLRPRPCRDDTVIHMRTVHFTNFGPPTIFLTRHLLEHAQLVSFQACWPFPALLWPSEESQSSRLSGDLPAVLGGYEGQ